MAGSHVKIDKVSTKAHLAAWTAKLGDTLARVVAEDARRTAPIDTGELRSSILWLRMPSAGSRQRWKIVARSGHAVYVELGTRYMAAQPYLRPALRRRRRVSRKGIRW